MSDRFASLKSNQTNMNKFQSKIQHEIHEILDLCNLIDSINCDLNEFEYLFTLINKEEIFITYNKKLTPFFKGVSEVGGLSAPCSPRF